MRVKRFVGDNVAEAMGKVKRELGSDAVILQTRQLKEGGVFGFFAKMKVEITAAVEDKSSKKDLPVEQTQAEKPSVNSDLIKKAYEAYREKENEFAEKKAASPKKEQGFEAAQSEIKEMHNILKEIRSELNRVQEREASYPHPLKKWLEVLTENGVSVDLGSELINKLANELREEQWTDNHLVLTKLRQLILRLCSNTATIKPGKDKPQVVALIGPTGVGKTTTIGKLAAGFSIIERKKVALITADTYRVAAVEQLKTFGEIIGVPVEVVMTPAGLKDAVEQHQDKELIFIDTAGRSPYHELHMSELKEFLTEAKPDLTMLVMSVTTNLADQMIVFKRFENLSSHLIFTKLDETLKIGCILDLIAKTGLPVAYLTNGQNVPDDIEAATPVKLTRIILGEGMANE